MPGCQLSLQHRRGRIEFALDGTFDGPSAWELAQRMEAERGELAIDFSRAASINDYALMVLSHALLELRGRGAVLIGLRHHQLRMLQYLGVTVSDAGVVEPPGEPALIDAPILAQIPSNTVVLSEV